MARGIWVQQLRDHGARVFGIDLRALAAFRIGLGLTLLAYVVSTALDFESLLTGRGVLPIHAIWSPGSVGSTVASLFVFSDTPTFVALLLGVMAAASLLLALGIQTRVATIFLWVGVSFLVRRNPWIHNAAHAMILFSLLWAMFLPLSARFAVGRSPRGMRLQHVSPATVGLILQVMIVYVTAGFAKTGPEWHAEADAIFLIANSQKYQTVFSPLLVALPDSVLAILTQSIWYLEVLSPWALVSPLYFIRARTTAALLLIVMHIGLGIFIRLGVFPAIAIAYLIILLPRPFWDRLSRDLGPKNEVDDVGAGGGFARYAANAFAVLLIVCMFTRYLEYVPGFGGNSPVWMRRMAGELRIGNVYRLFSRVSRSESRYLVLGKFNDGSTLDLLSGTPAQITWDTGRISIAPDGSDRFPWVSYTATAGKARFTDSAQSVEYAAYFCRNLQSSSKQLEQVEIMHLLRRVGSRSQNRFASRVAYVYECPEASS